MNSYELFLSYSSIDRIYAEKLAQDLSSWGITVWWDAWEIKVGDSLTQKIQEGLSSSSWLAVILTPDSVKSAWVQRELSSALIKEIHTKGVVVLPLLFRDCEIPPFLSDKAYADFRSSYEKGLQALLARLSPPVIPKTVEKLLSENKMKILSTFSEIPAERKDQYLDHLLNLLMTGSTDIKCKSLYALWAVNHELMPALLLRMIKDPSNTVRRSTIHLMGESNDKAYTGILSGLMSHGDPTVRFTAKQALEKIARNRRI